MKGRMDVLNLNKQRSPKSSAYKEIIRIETDEREKENCKDISDCSDLVIDMRNKEAASLKIETSVEDVEMDEDDDIVPDLPVLSVIIKEEDGVLEYNDGVPMPKTRSDVDIKYEDDIEEEEYDSEDSVSIKEMPHLSGRSGIAKENSGQISTQPSRRTPIQSFDDTFLNTGHLDSSMLDFDRDTLTKGLLSNGSLEGVEKASDSVLLTIVYATINVPFSQVSKFLTAYKLSKSQLSIIRKVRRQVKNRLYAQNCRRRRVAHIRNLATELQQIRMQKEKLYNQKHELRAKKEAMEKRYDELYEHIMNAVKERCRSQSCEFDDISDEEELEETQQLLVNENFDLEESKKKLEEEYRTLYEHVFKTIAERNTETNCLTKKGVENPFNLQLCNMNIVNELAILHKYYHKNNVSKAGDFDSSVSMDGSRTSENMNDFVDYESSISMDGSRTEENTRDDIVEYEELSMNDDDTCNDETSVSEKVKDTPTTVTVNNIHEIEDIRLEEDDTSRVSNQEDENKSRVSEDIIPMDESRSRDEEVKLTEENTGRMGEDDVIEWSEDSEEEEDFLDLQKLRSIKDELEAKKKNLGEQYAKLYNHILQAAQMNEVEFLRAFMDYCITLLRVPGRVSCSEN